MSLALLPRIFEEEFCRAATTQVGISETENTWIVRAPLPGIKKEELDVSIKERVLTLQGEAKKEEKKETIHRALSSRFAYEIILPENIDENGAIEASLEHGILTISLPKARKAGAVKISVK